VESDDLILFVIPGRVKREPGISRFLVLRTIPEWRWRILTKAGRGLIAAPMNNAATILIARRRRSSAVWADICV
jgi:hypothetical protein